jgi:N-acetylglucosamine-6-phosphate deacetylase
MTTSVHHFIDLQVNGYGGFDFNSELSVSQLEEACERLLADGVAGILATLITDDIDRMACRLANLATAHAASELVRQVIRGVHLEGPFISGLEGYVGAHPAEAVRPANLVDMERLFDHGQGLVRMVTLSPESDDGGAVTRWLADHGVVISAGHCNPSLDQLEASIDSGLTMFTHLGNGCPRLMDRHENIINRALSLSDRLWICFIADGIHVPFPALGNYLRVVGVDRAIVVSDAIAATGLGPGEYRLGQRRVTVDEGLATWSADRKHLIGSATPMRVAFENLRTAIGLAEGDAVRLTRENPTTAMGW